MEPIFDKNGKTVGWLQQDKIYDTNGNPISFVRNRAVYTYSGRYLGTCVNGFFRDKNGDAVAFIRSAEGGPLKPIPEIPPIPPIPSLAPIPPITPVPPIPPISSLNWSRLSWVKYLREE
jgi:hypothetical protein